MGFPVIRPVRAVAREHLLVGQQPHQQPLGQVLVDGDLARVEFGLLADSQVGDPDPRQLRR